MSIIVAEAYFQIKKKQKNIARGKSDYTHAHARRRSAIDLPCCSVAISSSVVATRSFRRGSTADVVCVVRAAETIEPTTTDRNNRRSCYIILPYYFRCTPFISLQARLENRMARIASLVELRQHRPAPDSR